MDEHRPTVLAVETVFHGKSFASVLKLGEARGVVLLTAALHGLEIEEYTPALVKRSVTGSGRASKRQVQLMVTRLLGLDEVPEPADVTDALALAFCSAQRLWRARDRGRSAAARFSPPRAPPSRAALAVAALKTGSRRPRGGRLRERAKKGGT